jgi:hypothetical protein
MSEWIDFDNLLEFWTQSRIIFPTEARVAQLHKPYKFLNLKFWIQADWSQSIFPFSEPGSQQNQATPKNWKEL